MGHETSIAESPAGWQGITLIGGMINLKPGHDLHITPTQHFDCNFNPLANFDLNV